MKISSLIIVVFIFSIKYSYGASVSVHYVDGVIDKVGTGYDSIVTDEGSKKGYQKRTMVQGWSFKKRKVVPKIDMEIHWTLQDEEYKTTYTYEKKL